MIVIQYSIARIQWTAWFSKLKKAMIQMSEAKATLLNSNFQANSQLILKHLDS